MNEEIKKCLLSDICQVISAKSYNPSDSQTGKVEQALFVSKTVEIGKTLSFFTSEKKESGYYLLSEYRRNLLYCSFLLNSGLGMIYMHDDGSLSYSKATVTKKKLMNMTINMIPERLERACIILELIITRVTQIKVDVDTSVTRDTVVSFLKNMRSYISLEIYLNNFFKSRNVSVLEPWTQFVEKMGDSYKLNVIDDVFISFYKSISDPDNDIMEAIKKAKLFVWEVSDNLINKKNELEY